MVPDNPATGYELYLNPQTNTHPYTHTHKYTYTHTHTHTHTFDLNHAASYIESSEFMDLF